MNASTTKMARADRTKVQPGRHCRSDGMEPDAAWLERYAVISKHPFFEGLSPKQLELLTDDALEMQFAPNEFIFREGNPANRFYLILEGKVALETEVEGHGMIPIQTLGPGDELGWSWLFPPHYLQSNAWALEPTKVLFFYGTRLRGQCERDHDLGYHIMKRTTSAILNRLQEARRQLLNHSLVAIKPSN